MSSNGNRSAGRSVALYAAMQSLNLAFCWGWFAVLGLVALTQYDFDQAAFWLLFGAACAGLYGLRPNVERTIDKIWTGDGATAASRERAEQLRPVKRRIDIVFSIFILILLCAIMVLWTFQVIQSVLGVKT